MLRYVVRMQLGSLVRASLSHTETSKLIDRVGSAPLRMTARGEKRRLATTPHLQFVYFVLGVRLNRPHLLDDAVVVLQLRGQVRHTAHPCRLVQSGLHAEKVLADGRHIGGGWVTLGVLMECRRWDFML